MLNAAMHALQMALAMGWEILWPLMIGGMTTAPLLSLFVLPAIYKLLGWEHFLPVSSGDGAMVVLAP